MLQVSQISEKQKERLQERTGGGEAMALGWDESGMGRIAQLPFWTREGSFPLSDTELLSSEHALTDPGSGRVGSLAAPSCLRVKESYRGMCKNLKTCLCQ